MEKTYPSHMEKVTPDPRVKAERSWHQGKCKQREGE
jgi:hypothetical protein